MKIQSSSQRKNRSAGFTIIEMAVSTSVLGAFALLLVGTGDVGSSMAEMGNAKARMHQQSQKAMNRILEDLRLTAFVTLDGQELPHVFDDGFPDAGFEDFEYVPGAVTAAPGSVGLGPMRSIILAMPSDLDGDERPEIDADGNGIPEIDGNGDGVHTDSIADIDGLWDPNEVVIDPSTRLCWSRDQVAYIVTPTGPDGENELVRVVGDINGPREVLARGVERVQFDTPESSGFAIPTETIRVTIHFRLTAADGVVYRSTYESRVGTQAH